MGFGVVEEKELPEYTIADANKTLKVDSNGVFLQWLAETSELPTQTGATSGSLLQTNGTTTSWTNTPTVSVINTGTGALAGIKWGSNTGVDGTTSGVNLRVGGVTIVGVSSNTVTSTGVINITHTGSASNPSLSFGDRVAGSLSGIYANPTDDNINICTGSVERFRVSNTTTTVSNNLSVTGNITATGALNLGGYGYSRNFNWTPSAGAFVSLTYDIATHGHAVQINAVNDNQNIIINLPSLNIAGYQNRTYLLTFDLILDNARSDTTCRFAYQSPSVRLSTGNRPAQEYNGELVYEPRSWRLDTPGGSLSRRDLRGGPISFLVTTNSIYTWYRPITNDDDFIEDVGSINCIGAGGLGPYSLDVDNTIVNRTLYKYNEVVGAPNGSNITLNFGQLSDADNKFTVCFTMSSGNPTGNFIIANTMVSPHRVIIFSGGVCADLGNGGSTARDGQSILRCTYYHNRFNSTSHWWVIHVF